MKVLVTGSRDWDDSFLVDVVLWGLFTRHAALFTVAHGAARGADTMAHNWVDLYGSRLGASEARYPADWEKDGKAAGPIRNQRMLDEFKPDLVVAFKNDMDPELKRGGTEHMVRIAKKAGVPVVVVRHG